MTEDEADTSEENVFRDMTFEEILEDLNARFLINLPREEMSLVRVYWQAEQAHWFYEDYLRPLNPLLPSYSQRNFTHLIIASSPLYSHLGVKDYDGVWEEYCTYKRMVPCCGGILINKGGDKCLMVRGWKSNAGWSFPRGKINSEESEVDCAIREVEEETGFDLTGLINPIDNIQTQVNAQMVTMFIVKDIDEDTVFETQTRMEIGAIEWVRLADLPTWTNKRGPKMTAEKGKKKFYNVTPFVGPLKRWLVEHGIDPRAKSKRPPASASKSTSPALRNLEPYFDPTSGSALLEARHASALDDLFGRFVHKQEEDLEVPEKDTADGSDTKAGLERLFESLNNGSSKMKTDEEEEEDALARLLGTVSVTPSIKPHQPQPAYNYDRKQAKLLNSQPLLTVMQDPSSGVTLLDQRSPIKPHQASLLGILSPGPGPTATSPSPFLDADLLVAQKTSPVVTAPKPHAMDPEARRAEKQRELLEQITGSLGVNLPQQTQTGAEGSSAFQDLSHIRPSQVSRSASLTSSTIAAPHLLFDPPLPPPPLARNNPSHEYPPSRSYNGDFPSLGQIQSVPPGPTVQLTDRDRGMLGSLNRDQARPSQVQPDMHPPPIHQLTPRHASRHALPNPVYGSNGYTDHHHSFASNSIHPNPNLSSTGMLPETRHVPPQPPPQYQSIPHSPQYHHYAPQFPPQFLPQGPYPRNYLPNSAPQVYRPPPRPPNAALLGILHGNVPNGITPRD